jgi:hypothetical protein
MSTFRLFIAGVILLCFFISCRKEDTPAAGDKLLRQTASWISDFSDSCFYVYNAQRQLITINVRHSIWEDNRKTFIEYNATGDPLKFINYDHVPYRQDSVWADLLVYKNGKVVEKRVSSFNNGSYVSSNNYTYDMKGRLIRDSAGKSGYTDFIYDENDNVVQTNMFSSLGDTVMINTYTLTASYDGNINPYNNLGLTLYFITNSDKLLSKHNRISDTFLGYYDYNTGKYDVNTEKYTYEYENGLVKKMTRTWEQHPYPSYPYSETVDFYYD